MDWETIAAMWVPRAFRQDDIETLHRLVEAHPFAPVVSRDGDHLLATHLPLVLDPRRGPKGTLIGHMARANPHWRSLGGEVLVIFQGPHAYVSPSWYRDRGAVPTWNYAVVHAYGSVTLFHDPKELEPMVTRLARLHEGTVRCPGHADRAIPVREEDLVRIVGLEIRVSRLEGKFKLSQNRTVEDRRRVAAALHRSDDSTERGVAELMRRVDEGLRDVGPGGVPRDPRDPPSDGENRAGSSARVGDPPGCAGPNPGDGSPRHGE